MDIKVPTLGESITEATVAKWFKQAGDAVAQDEPLVELETDKVTVEVNAPVAGVLAEIKMPEGSEVAVGAILGVITEGAAGAKAPAKPAAKPAEKTADKPGEKSAEKSAEKAAEKPTEKPSEKATAPAPVAKAEAAPLSPAVRKMAAETKIDPATIAGTGKDGRVTKGDMIAAQDKPAASTAPAVPTAPAPAKSTTSPRSGGPEQRVRMTRLRKRIAERLKEAQNTAAMLTTFNEVDMTAILALRAQFKESYEKKHGVRLGFMSFFVKACIAALKEIPAVNARIDGDDLVYHNFYDIGVAVGTEQGLVVPVVRDADNMGFADIEKKIGELGKKARDGKLTMDDLTGGTFTISNGGVYGSLMSTPILNPPQSGILGMHKTQSRPMVIGDKIEIRPMMYLALSYDHRVVDGREAVTFLVRVKECLEDPARMLVEI